MDLKFVLIFWQVLNKRIDMDLFFVFEPDLMVVLIFVAGWELFWAVSFFCCGVLAGCGFVF